MLAAAVNISKKPDLPFNQSLETQPANLPLAYTRRRTHKLDPANVTAIVATSRIRALSTVIVIKRLPCGQCKSSAQALSLAGRLVVISLVLSSGPTQTGTLTQSAFHPSLDLIAKDAVSCMVLQPRLCDMPTYRPITYKWT